MRREREPLGRGPHDDGRLWVFAAAVVVLGIALAWWLQRDKAALDGLTHEVPLTGPSDASGE